MKGQRTKTRNRSTAKSRARDRRLARFAACEAACRDVRERPPTATFAGADASAIALGQADQQPRISVDDVSAGADDLRFLIGEDVEASATSEPDEVEGPVRTTATCTCTLTRSDESDLADDGCGTTDVGLGGGVPEERPERPARAVLSVPATRVLTGADDVSVESETLGGTGKDPAGSKVGGAT